MCSVLLFCLQNFNMYANCSKNSTHTKKVMKGRPEEGVVFHVERRKEANSRFSLQTHLILNYYPEN
jgi:hypothetical protein